MSPVPEAEFDAAYWERHYAEQERHRGHGRHGASPSLLDHATEVSPGTALDAGCGEGTDTLWLASRGWRVTAVDVSPIAVDRARQRAVAEQPGVADRIEWVVADLTTWRPAGSFDLVSAQFVHLPAAATAAFYRQLVASVAPGGSLLVAGHDPSHHRTAGGHDPASDLETVLVAVADAPDEWELVRQGATVLARRSG